MTSPASAIFGIPATGAVTSVETASLPVDKGGLSPRPKPSSRLTLQRLCYGIAAAFFAAGVVMSFVFDVAVMILFAIPVTLFCIAAIALGLPQPSLRQRTALWCVAATMLVALGIGMMPRELGETMEALRDFGFMTSTAATVLSGLCAVLPPYNENMAGKGDKGLRYASVIFCFCLTIVSYMTVFFVCTPHVH
ncbi:MAG: hypothetical protein ACAH80_12220 [Alphaproteobacteria bacterium]